MNPNRNNNWFRGSLLNSYSQVFFSDNKLFAAILIPVTFMDLYAGMFGMLSVVITNLTAWLIGFETYKITKGYYGFNSLLVGLGLGIYFEPGLMLLMIVVLAAILTLIFSVAIEGVISKYELPHLSLPFVFALWTLMLATREFSALGLNERWIYTLNDLYLIGGSSLVSLYEWWNSIPIPVSLRSYFLSLGAILFQYSVLSGIILAIGLLIYSRIAFSLSIGGFYIAWLFYHMIGAEVSEVSYSYIGFNYILTSIAIGGFFIIPNRNSYMALLVLIPVVALITVSLSAILATFRLPVYALPFNVMVLAYLYVLKFRTDNRAGLSTLFIQRNSPEKNLYAYTSFMERFGKEVPVPIHLPFYGEWIVTQGHDGEYTHKTGWRHAWDFEIVDEGGKTYRGDGDFQKDYYCYGKTIIAPAGGTVENIIDGIPDNVIGEKDLENNWGNTIVLKHSDFIYSKLSHLKSGSILVKNGDMVKKGDNLAQCGNSGNSPYPHLHFQVQAYPHIGSKTIDYPLSNLFVKRNASTRLMAVATPEKNDLVSNVRIEPVLQKAFKFVPGEIITFSPQDGEVVWEVKLDEFLNKYIECTRSGSRAWFRTDDAMMAFTHFDGDRSSLLYYFYLAAFRVSFGCCTDLTITDTYPVNLIFNPNSIPLQDFIAPFYIYLKGQYTLRYPDWKNIIPGRDVRLEGDITKTAFGRNRGTMHFRFLIGDNGISEFSVTSGHLQINAKCTKGSPSY